MSNVGKPRIEIELGPFKSIDLEVVSKWQNSIEDKRIVMGFRLPVSDVTSSDWLKQRIAPLSKHPTSIYWAVRTLPEDQLIGYVTVFEIDYVSGTAEIGIYIGEHRNSGIGTQSILKCLERSKKDLNLRKIIARTLASNLNASGVFKKLGFLNEGTLKAQYWDGETHCDIQILSKFI